MVLATVIGVTHYDLVIIGAGSGNTIVDHRFADWRVAIIEGGAFGGTCLNRGCIPSKMYVHPADVAEEASHGPALGVATSFSGVDWPTIRDRIFTRIDGIATGGRHYRERALNVDVLVGGARFTGPRELVVSLEDGTSTQVTGDQVVIATGGRPVVPDLPGLDAVEHHTSDTIMRLDSFPERLGIVGGGYVGCEFAHVFSSFGAQVSLVHSRPLLLWAQDHDIAARFTEHNRDRWDVRLDARLTRVHRGTSGDITLELADGASIDVDTLLVAVGRTTNNDRLDLTVAGVEVGPDGLIVVDRHQRTSAEGVWALGDASSPEPLKHVANQDARVVQHNLLHPDDLRETDHRFVPNAVFSSPQVASVGLTEDRARAEGVDIAVATHEYADVAYGWAMQAGDGADLGSMVKLVADRTTGLLVGAHVVGPHASMLVQPLIQAMSFGQPVRGLAGGQYWIHPALTEVVENALLKLEGYLG